MRLTEEQYADLVRKGGPQDATAIRRAIDEAGSKAEAKLARQLKRLNVHIDREFRFHPIRDWRFDFAIPEYMVAIEVEGGIHMMGRHQRPEGFSEDCRKYNAAALAGWRVLRFTPAMIETGEAAEIIASGCMP